MHVSSWPCGAVLFLLACGSAPTTPSSPAPTPAAPGLPPGAYYFAVSQGSNTISGPGGGTFTTSICLGIGSYPTTVQVPVTMEIEGGTYRVRATRGSLLLTLSASAAGVSGIAQGDAHDGTGAFKISIQGTEPAGLSGSVSGNGTASGRVEGNVTLSGPGGSGGCSPSSWSLLTR